MNAIYSRCPAASDSSLVRVERAVQQTRISNRDVAIAFNG